MNKKEAWEIVGGLSDPGKMPCKGYSIPAAECHVGSELREVKDSVCNKCYALKGRYPFPNVQNAMYRRFKLMRGKHWVEAMSFLIKDMPYFRWHDSGDIQDVSHLNRIMDIAENTPNTKYWLPTREYKIVEDTLKKRKCPKNLCIRLSAHMIEQSGPVVLAKRLGVQMSEVAKTEYNCPAHEQDNYCKDCRKCWDKRVKTVVYRLH